MRLWKSWYREIRDEKRSLRLVKGAGSFCTADYSEWFVTLDLKKVTVQPYQLELVVSPPIRCNAAQILAYGRGHIQIQQNCLVASKLANPFLLDLCMAELLRKK